MQHLPPAWDNGSLTAHRRVTLIAEGHQPVARDILLSGTDDHLIMGEDRRLHYSAEPRRVLPPVG